MDKSPGQSPPGAAGGSSQQEEHAAEGILPADHWREVSALRASIDKETYANRFLSEKATDPKTTTTTATAILRLVLMLAAQLLR